MPSFWRFRILFLLASSSQMEMFWSSPHPTTESQIKTKAKTSPKTWIVIPCGSKAHPSSLDYHTSSWHHSKQPHPFCIPLHIPPMKMSVCLWWGQSGMFQGGLWVFVSVFPPRLLSHCQPVSQSSPILGLPGSHSVSVTHTPGMGISPIYRLACSFSAMTDTCV